MSILGILGIIALSFVVGGIGGLLAAVALRAAILADIRAEAAGDKAE